MAAVSIVEYGIGNTGSIVNMFRKLLVDAEVASTPEAVGKAERLVLPGVGAFDACVGALQRAGLRDAVLEYAVSRRALLGICVGMQMLTLGSEEGNLAGLGLINAYTRRLDARPGLRIPHMGWNSVRWMYPDHELARDLTAECRFYFVHSFHVVCQSATNSLATCNYGEDFCAAVVSNNIAGVQFHPEKSHRFGLKLLRNFVGK